MNLPLLRNNKGSALLVALLIMGILVSISVVLSILVFREARVTRDLVDAGKAYYAAESGVEIALYGLKHNLPGWEPEYDIDRDAKSFSVGVNDAGEFTSAGELTVDNRCQAYPCFDEDFDVSGLPTKAFYDVLDLNEAITIPLFTVEAGVEVPVGDFVVEFFAPFSPQEHLRIGGEELSGWDVLRWKLFGIRDEEPKRTETVSDFTAVKMIQGSIYDESGQLLEGQINTHAATPSWFGSRSTGCEGDESQRYTTGIDCLPYSEGHSDSIDVESIDDDSGGEQLSDYTQRADIYDVGCWPWEAREYYRYEYQSFDGERYLPTENIEDCFNIKEFMGSHDLKYLTLTNLVNPAVFNDEIQANTLKKEALSKLYYRVEFFEDETKPYPETGNETVREYASITSKGYSGDNAQSINVKIKRDSFMPVFNFSLYSTYKTEEFGHYYEVADDDS